VRAMDYRILPKIELHLHLDCSLSFAVVSRLQPGVTFAEFEKTFIAPAKCTDLADYITRAEAGVALMQTEEQLRFVVADLFDQLTADAIVYAEIRFAPLLHTRRGLSPDQVVEVVREAVARESERTRIEARVILCTLRHFSGEQSMETVRLLERFRGTLVVGLDIAGNEAGFPVDAHTPAFEHAASLGIPRTAHAGEARGPDSVWETLKVFQPERIGHGVRSIEDTSLITHLKAERIHLEVCPTSNVQTNVVQTYLHHHADALYRNGVPMSISTDARTISNMTLAREYDLLHRAFGWGPEQFRQCNLNAIEAAFIPERVKRDLTARLNEGYPARP